LRDIPMRARLFKFIVALSLAACLGGDAIARAGQETIEQVCQNYWGALQAKNWADLSSLVHAESLGLFRSRTRGITTSLLSMKFNEVREVINRQFRGSYAQQNFQSHEAHFTPMLESIRASSQEEFEKLSDREVFERILPHILETDFTYHPVVKNTTYRIVGIVRESDDVTHVVYRASVALPVEVGKGLKLAVEEREGAKVLSFCTTGGIMGMCREVELPSGGRVEVLSLRKQEDGWRILLDDRQIGLLSRWESSLKFQVQQFQGLAETILPYKSNLPPKTKPPRSSRKS
jgi:hypothetical protein